MFTRIEWLYNMDEFSIIYLLFMAILVFLFVWLLRELIISRQIKQAMFEEHRKNERNQLLLRPLSNEANEQPILFRDVLLDRSLITSAHFMEEEHHVRLEKEKQTYTLPKDTLDQLLLNLNLKTNNTYRVSGKHAIEDLQLIWPCFLEAPLQDVCIALYGEKQTGRLVDLAIMNILKRSTYLTLTEIAYITRSISGYGRHQFEARLKRFPNINRKRKRQFTKWIKKHTEVVNETK